MNFENNKIKVYSCIYVHEKSVFRFRSLFIFLGWSAIYLPITFFIFEEKNEMTMGCCIFFIILFLFCSVVQVVLAAMLIPGSIEIIIDEYFLYYRSNPLKKFKINLCSIDCVGYAQPLATYSSFAPESVSVSYKTTRGNNMIRIPDLFGMRSNEVIRIIKVHAERAKKKNNG